MQCTFQAVFFTAVHRTLGSDESGNLPRPCAAALLKERGFTLEVSAAAREYLAEAGYDADFGARPLKRAIQRELQDPLALRILSGAFHEGQAIQVDRAADGLTFTPVAQGEVVE